MFVSERSERTIDEQRVAHCESVVCLSCQETVLELCSSHKKESSKEENPSQKSCQQINIGQKTKKKHTARSVAGGATIRAALTPRPYNNKRR